MLVLKRKLDQSIMIGDEIELVVLGIEGDTVKLGIRAPKEVAVYRKEIYLEILNENQQASRPAFSVDQLADFLKGQFGNE